MGENRTIPVVNGVFTDTFATAATVHIYEVNDGGSSPPPPAPAAPVISTGVANSNESVTLTGTAPDGSTVTVSDGGATALGTATASSTGAWSFTTADLAAGSYAFTATDTTSAGTSAASSAFDVTVTSSSPPPSGSNLVANGNFATDSFSGWTLGGNYTSTTYGPEIFIDTDAEGSSTYAAGMGSVGSDGTLSQTIATTAGQTYTLSFWLQNEASGPNDFKAIWNGQTLLSLSNAAQSGYTEYTYTVTATGSSTALEFSAARSHPVGSRQYLADGEWNVIADAASAAPVISTGVENSNESVTLTGTAPDGSTVTVSDGGTTALGTATASSTGAWSFTTADLAAGSYAFTATDTTSAGTSAASSAFDVTVSSSSPPPVSATWNEIDHGDPVAMAAGDFEGLGSAQLVASETGGGTYIYVPSSATWTKIDGGVSSLMTEGDFYGASNGNANNADLAAYDPEVRTYIYEYGYGWTKIGSSTVSALAAGAFNGGSSGTELVASETGAGTYLWANGVGWTKIDGGVYSIMAAGDFYGASNGNANNTDLAAYDPGVGPTFGPQTWVGPRSMLARLRNLPPATSSAPATATITNRPSGLFPRLRDVHLEREHGLEQNRRWCCVCSPPSILMATDRTSCSPISRTMACTNGKRVLVGTNRQHVSAPHIGVAAVVYYRQLSRRFSRGCRCRFQGDRRRLARPAGRQFRSCCPGASHSRRSSDR